MYIVVEGVDGAGKTTIVDALSSRLSAESEVLVLREPPETFLGHVARSYFVEGGAKGKVDPVVAALLMIAARVDLHDQIGDDFDRKTVLSDRSFLSTCVYQQEAGKELLDSLLRRSGSSHFRLPDLVVYLRVDPEVAIQRTRSRGKEHLSEDQIWFFSRSYDEVIDDWARGGFISVLQVDGALPVDQIVGQICDRISSMTRD